jgi:hypothetical protein
MTYEEIFAAYGIHPKFWAGMQACAMAGAKPDAELQVRLDYVENYSSCLRDLLAGTRDNTPTSPAVTPFESIEVKNGQSDRFLGPHDCGG